MKRNALPLGIGAVVWLCAGCGHAPGGSGKAVSASTGAGPATTPSSTAPVGSEWTIMMFYNADNNLEQSALATVNAMESVGSSPNVSVVVELETQTLPFGTPYDHQGKRFLVTKGTDPTGIQSPTLQALGDVDGASPDEIGRFVKWAKTNFPARHYALVLSDHGGGWLGFGEDVSNKTSSSYTKLEQLVTAAGDALGQKFDIFGFDACEMASIEVQMLLARVARVGIGEEEIVPADWNYRESIAALIAQPTMDAATFAKTIVAKTGVTSRVLNKNPQVYTEDGNPCFQMTAVDLDKLGAVISSFQRFTQRHRSDLAALVPALAVSRVRSLSVGKLDQGGNSGDQVDLGDFVAQLATRVSDPDLAATSAAIAAAVLSQSKGVLSERATGLSVFFPTVDSRPSAFWGSILDAGTAGNYRTTAFAKATGWDAWVQAVFDAAGTQVAAVAAGKPASSVAITAASGTTASPSAPVTLSVQTTGNGASVSRLGLGVLQPATGSSAYSLGLLDVDPSATSITWDGTVVGLTDGTSTSALDTYAVLPGSSIFGASVDLSGNPGAVLVRIDPVTRAPSLLGVYWVTVDPASNIRGYSQVTASDLAGLVLTPQLAVVSPDGTVSGTVAGTKLGTGSLSAVRGPVSSGPHVLTLLGSDTASFTATASATISSP